MTNLVFACIGCFSLLNNERVVGELSHEQGSSGYSVSLTFDVDKELNKAIIDAAHSLEVPVSRLGYAVADDPAFYQPLDWGATVPLWFMGSSFEPQPEVVIACPDRGNMPWDSLHFPVLEWLSTIVFFQVHSPYHTLTHSPA